MDLIAARLPLQVKGLGFQSFMGFDCILFNNPHDTRCLHVEQQDFMDALSREVPNIGGARLGL